MRDLFSDRDFVAYFCARQGARLAYSIEGVAIGWQIYGLRHRAFDLALVGLILFLPQLLLAIPAGTLADRFDRRLLCVVCSAAEMAAILAFLALVVTGVHVLWINFAVVAAVGIAHALGDPAERTLLVNIVRSHHYVRAQAMTASLGEVISIAGPALGGALLAVGTPYAFAASAAAYAVASIAFSRLQPRPQAPDAPDAHDATEGIRFIFGRPVLLGAITLDLFAVLFGGAIALLPIYATQILHVGAVGFGALRAAPAAGATIVSAYLARRPLRRKAGPTLLWVVAGFGAAMVVFGLSRDVLLSLAALAAAGGFDIVSVVIRSALVQLNTPDAMRGRVSAVENIFIGASNQLGGFESGATAAFFGPVLSVVGGGIATIVVVLAALKVFPAIARYDRLDEAPAE